MLDVGLIWDADTTLQRARLFEREGCMRSDSIDR